MDARDRRLREQILKIQADKGNRSRRYPRHLRDEIIACAEEGRAQGTTLSVVARRLGLPAHTLYGWLSASEERPAFHPVRVLPGSTSSSPVLVTPQGYRIEGLEVSSLVALLRELS